MDNYHAERLLDAYCLQAKYVERLEAALQVFLTCPETRRLLQDNDPMALRQADTAINYPNKGKGGTIGGDRDSETERKEKCDTCDKLMCGNCIRGPHRTDYPKTDNWKAIEKTCESCAGFQGCYFKPVTEITPADIYEGEGDCNYYRAKQ